MLDKIIRVLNVQNTEYLYDLAGETREGIPADVLEMIKKNSELIKYIRKYNKRGDF